MTLLPRFVIHTNLLRTNENRNFFLETLGYHINLLVVNIEAFFPGQVVGFSKRFHFYGKEQSGVHFTAQWLFGVKRCLLQNLNPQDDYS